jgi:predicted CoA-substrate-specific enzyme activase
MPFVAGLDIGSATTKAVVIDVGSTGVLAGNHGQDAHATIAGRAIAPTGADSRATARATLDSACAEAGCPPNDLRAIVASGYGRRLVEWATEVINEISANALGVTHLLGNKHHVGTIIDIGGQDSKVIRLDANGRMSDFAMNDKCAAGTGRFLENIARALGLDIAELGRVSLESSAPEPVSSLCAVFAESEIVSLLAQGKTVADIAAGIHAAAARRIGQLARQVGVEREVVLNGGGALNVGLRRALEDELGVELIVPEPAQFCVALGAALAAQSHKRG